MRLNLGSGKTLIPGHINIDILDYGQEIKRDITAGLPFGNGSIAEIYTCHFLEHLKPNQIPFVMHEIWRVLISNGKLIARTPHADSPTAFDPAHHSYWDHNRLKGFLHMGLMAKHDHFFDYAITSSNKEKEDFLFTLQALKHKMYFVMDNGLYESYLVVYRTER